jgi:putative Mg2+ transporter-C (MgtC) family protein
VQFFNQNDDKVTMESVLEKVDLQSLVPMVVAVVLGALIGIEREVHSKPAGLRTNALICMGAAAFMVIAQRIGLGNDAVSRMTAGIVTGVGFIGGGAVLRDRTNISGVTTAATIWVVTSIGIACGMRLYDMAVSITVLSLIVLAVFGPLDRKIRKTKDPEPQQ